MTERKDKITAVIYKATDILFISNPIGTSVGVMFGIVLDGVTKIFTPFFKNDKYMSLPSVGMLFYMALGVFLLNIRQVFRRPQFDGSIEAALTLIRTARKEKNLTASETRMMYRTLFSKIIQEVSLTNEVQSKIDDYFKSDSK